MPTDPPNASPEANLWRHVDDFPVTGAVLRDVATNEHVFVIGGSAEAPTDACPTQRDPRIWTSADGRTWQRRDVGRGVNASVTALAGHLAVGTTGCDGEEPVAWRAAPLDFIEILSDGLDLTDEVVDLAETIDHDFIASGRRNESDDAMAIWTGSFDGKAGIDWIAANNAPPSVRASTLTSLAATAGAVVGFDLTRDPYAWYSADGDAWTESSLRPAYGLLTTGSAADQHGFVGAGRGCCGLPDRRFGVIVHSIDGHDWTEARAEHFAEPIEAVAATSAGFIALGKETYLSSDGSDWRLGPALPGYVDRVDVVNREPVPYRLKVAVLGSNLVVIGPIDVWTASLDELSADRWPERAPAAAMPVVGEQYDTTLATHCGPFNGPLYFAARSWVPELPEGYYPLSFDYYYETGTLGYVADDRLEFTGAKGDIVPFLPSDDPPHGAPCH